VEHPVYLDLRVKWPLSVRCQWILLPPAGVASVDFSRLFY